MDFSREPTSKSAPIALEQPRPVSGPGLWFFRLLFRPTAFLRAQLGDMPPAATLAAAYVAGVSAAVARMDKQTAKYVSGDVQLGGLATLVEGWGAYWAWCLTLGGAIGAAFVFFLGGWWFRRRLVWSGVGDHDARVARRAYILCAQVDSIPFLLYAVWRTLAFDTPTAVFAEPHPSSVLLFAFPFWASFVSYRAATKVFGAHRFRALFYFLGLPWLLYAVALVGVLGGAVAGR